MKTAESAWHSGALATAGQRLQSCSRAAPTTRLKITGTRHFSANPKASSGTSLWRTKRSLSTYLLQTLTRLHPPEAGEAAARAGARNRNRLERAPPDRRTPQALTSRGKRALPRRSHRRALLPSQCLPPTRLKAVKRTRNRSSTSPPSLLLGTLFAQCTYLLTSTKIN